MHLDFSSFIIVLFGHLVWSDRFSLHSDTLFLRAISKGLNVNWSIGQNLMLFMCFLTLSMFNHSGLGRRPPERQTVLTKYQILTPAHRFN